MAQQRTRATTTGDAAKDADTTAPPAPDAASAAGPADATSPPDPAAAPATDPAPAPVEPDPRVSTCVVNRGRGMHVGGAVNGKVCSYHAMHYDANGNRR